MSKYLRIPYSLGLCNDIFSENHVIEKRSKYNCEKYKLCEQSVKKHSNMALLHYKCISMTN